MRILLVDDDETLLEALAETLIAQRYAVDTATDGETAREFLALFPYDLIVLDRSLPDAEGISLCQQFRQQGIKAPILMLTARDRSADKVQALDAGADDYMVKPFDFGELCARIRALLRRDSHQAAPALRWGSLSLNPSTFEVFYDDHLLHTTPKEYALLELFLRHPTQVFSLDAIIEDIWSFEDPPSGDAVRTHIKGLRQKLRAGGAPKNLIETVYGVGYRLHPLEPEVPSETPSPGAALRQPTPAEMQASLAQVWETHRGTLDERLSVLESAAAAVEGGQLSSDLRQAGCSQAHKLAGSLGCYGFKEGSQMARQLEQMLQRTAPLDDRQATQMVQLVGRLRQNLAQEPSPGPPTGTPTSPPQLWIVGASPGFSESLAAEAIALGIRSRTAATLAQAQAMLQTEPPAVVVLWLTETDGDSARNLLEAIGHQGDRIAVLIVTDSQDFQQRLRWVQQGADRLLPPSVSPRHVLETVQQALRVDSTAIALVALDDDVQVLDLLQSILSPWGMELTTLTDPAQLWDTLERVQPQLLVLDVEMPTLNGLELCQVLRADDRWRQLPILFLTVHEDAQTLQKAFAVGADDFVSKSALATELPRRILHRLQ
ncbi:response regulator [Leptolyngbya sp. KIOST-1]|uniref:response regulator n=1 Tax=Leptolyngbya sp. KIOST-1 TaxID=1229172 RepID=UPI0005625629|nr:response regulator [Leptolyngbya sp. KIOST-1]